MGGAVRALAACQLGEPTADQVDGRRRGRRRPALFLRLRSLHTHRSTSPPRPSELFRRPPETTPVCGSCRTEAASPVLPTPAGDYPSRQMAKCVRRSPPTTSAQKCSAVIPDLVTSPYLELRLTSIAFPPSVVVRHCIPLRRSAFKKFCKVRAGMAGVKIKRGSALDDTAAAQCPRCDRRQHRRCIRGTYCTAKQRSPPVCSKRATERAEKRAARKAKRAAVRRLMVDPTWPTWHPIAGIWVARPLGVDSRYAVSVPTAAFGDLLPLGGEARFTEGLVGDPHRVFSLPTAAPPADGVVEFAVQLAPTAVEGWRLVVAAGLEVRACGADVSVDHTHRVASVDPHVNVAAILFSS